MAGRTRRDPVGQGREVNERLDLLERRLALFPTPFVLPARLEQGGFDVVSSFRGTAAQRDALYGVPATDADRVALANARIVWFNTEQGWEESYYATTGLPGLTARGLMAGAASGWYPTTVGPACILAPTAQVSTPAPGATSYVGGWAGSIYRRGGTSWFTNNSGAIFTQVAGYYDLRAWTIQAGGTALMNYHLVILDSANAEVTRHDGGAFPQNSSLYTTVDMAMFGKYMRPGDQFLLRVWGGGPINVHMGGATDTRGQLIVRYAGPPLVSE